MADKRIHRHPGITILLVMLILSIVATIALGVAFLILRQFQQGLDVKASFNAQNAADSGAEEFLYRTKVSRSTQTSPTALVTELTDLYGCSKASSFWKDVGNYSKFCFDPTAQQTQDQAFEGSIKENSTLTVDLFNPEVSDPNDANFANVKAVKLKGVAEAGTWLEVTWVAWEATGSVLNFKSSATKSFFSGTEDADFTGSTGKKIVFLNNGGNFVPGTNSRVLYLLNSPNGLGNCENSTNAADLTAMMTNQECICRDQNVATADANSCPFANSAAGVPFNYILRIKALYGNVSNIKVEACKDVACTQIQSIPSRLTGKFQGISNNVKQAVTASIPWSLPLAGLYDYAILSEETLTKSTQVNPGFFTTGVIEAEKDTNSFEANLAPFTCAMTGNVCTRNPGSAWTASNANCRVDPKNGASGNVSGTDGATCAPISDPGWLTYTVPSGLIGDTAISLYVNVRYRVTSELQNESLCQIGYIFSEDNTGCDGNPYSNPASRIQGENELDHKAEDGWLTCTPNRMNLKDGSSFSFISTPGKPAPRIDWINLSTVPYAPLSQCKFQAWGASGTYDYQIENFLGAANCSGFSGASECTLNTNWFGNLRVGTPAVPGTPEFICNTANVSGSCYVYADNYTGGVGAPTGFAYPLKDSLLPLPNGVDTKIAEGNYYVTIYYGLNNALPANKAYRLDAAPIGNDTLDFDIYQYPKQAGKDYNGFANTLYNTKSSYQVTLSGPKTSNVAGSCVLPTKLRVHSGDSFAMKLKDMSSAAFQHPWFTIDRFTLTADPPALPTCLP